MNGKRRLKEAKYMNEHGSMHNLKAAGPNNQKKKGQMLDKQITA